MLLSICIPTYNRKESLSNLIGFLEDELCDGVEVVIVDNASDYLPGNVPTIRKVLESGKPIRIVRNKSNVGAGANVMRCFELAEGQWVWIFGDDDIPEKGAIKKVVSILRASTNVLAYNFATTILSNQGISRKEVVEASGIMDFASKVDCFSNLLFISASIFKKHYMLPHLRSGYYMLGSCAPHLAVLLSAIEAGNNSVIFHPLNIVKWNIDTLGGWKLSVVFPKLRQLFCVIENEQARKLLAIKNSFSHPMGALSFRWSARAIKSWVLMDDSIAYHSFLMWTENLAAHTIDYGHVSLRLCLRFILSLALFWFCRVARCLLLLIAHTFKCKTLRTALNRSSPYSRATHNSSILGDSRI